MQDPFPHTINFEIDRAELERYMKRQGLYVISGMFLILGFLFILGHLTDATQGLNFSSRNELILFLLGRLGVCILILILIISLVYIFGVRKHCRRYASTLKVSVEGPYLRIQEHSTRAVDRKIHFRSIVDYSNIQSPMMSRYGIQTLKMRTTSGGQDSTISIQGIRDCLKVRDILSEIDQQREKI